MSERLLKWAIKRHYIALGYKVSMRRIRLGNAEIDGEAVGPTGERIAIEIKTPNDDIVRGIGQLTEALAFGYNKPVLVTTLNAKKIDRTAFQKFGFTLLGVNSNGEAKCI